MSQTSAQLDYAPWPTGERRRPADRRLGERRLELVGVEAERRLGADRRRPVGRRESASGHIRNALQVLESALDESERDGDSMERDTILAAIDRLRQALHEVDRLAQDRSHLGQLFRLTERGLPPDTLPGLRAWPA
ncbi:MAG: hypothetical protein A3K13_01690 [Gemmatimonadetes bacterium RIFCSPLOWO2_12_FULL_68_9]|nr:MAG: hypothetical protein A3K13_01690 [Gemmatimonadetes bacterium RIFCSPLOWO2_12_FULL_68_9]